jgi:hypothetical protein
MTHALREPCPIEEAGVQRFTALDTADQGHWQSWLGKQLTASVRLIWTDNRASMISARGNAATGYHLRVHQMFRQAPEAVWHALVAYIRDTDAVASRTLRAYIRHQQPLICNPLQHRQRSHLLQPQGRYFDLEDIYREVNQTYLANQVQAGITWSRRPPKRQRTSIRFGSYHPRERLIRIHCLLDQVFVPRYVVANVVFHEMLHQLIPRQRINGRWYIHPPAFRQQERRFPHYQQAEQWQRQHLTRLLRS